jgi:copper chaperone CopZ
MSPPLKTFVAAVACSLSMAVAAHAETKVTLKGVHLCCPQCVTIVGTTLKDLPGVKGECSQGDKTIVLTADNNEAAQKAIDALATAGFYGKLDNDAVKFKPIDVPKGNVQRLEVSGVHNCCGQCARIIKGAVVKVKGVSADTTIGPNKETFVVEGDFSAQELVDALLAEGFHVQVKK